MHDYPSQRSSSNSSQQIRSYPKREYSSKSSSSYNPYNHPGLYSNSALYIQEKQPSLEFQRILHSESQRPQSQDKSYYRDSHLRSEINMRGDYHGNNQNTTAGVNSTASKFGENYMTSPETRERTSIGNGDYGRETTATAIHGNRDGITRGSIRGSNSRSYMPTTSKTSMTTKQWNSQPLQQQSQFQRNATTDSVSLRRCPSRFLSSTYSVPSSASLGGHRAAMLSRSNGSECQSFEKYGPDREKMKNDLAYSNSIAKSSIPGIGILPGTGHQIRNRNTGRRQYHNSFPTPRSDMGSSNSPHNSSREPFSTGENEIQSHQGSPSSATAMFRAQEAIEDLRSNVSKANDLAHDNLNSYKNTACMWINQGMPITDEQALLQDKTSSVQKRHLQESYRYELERQIEETKQRKEIEKEKALSHPLGPKYDSPGLSHWHQSSTVIPPEKTAALAKLLLEKSTPSSSRLNQSPEYARREAALENLRKSRAGPHLFQTNNGNNYDYQNIPNGNASTNNNNSLSQTQSHQVAQVFRTNSSLSNQSPEIPPSNPQQNCNNSSQNMGTNSNYNQPQTHQLQYQQASHGINPTLSQNTRDPALIPPNQYQPQTQRQTQINYPSNNSVPMGFGQPVPGLYPNGYGPGPWPNVIQQQQPLPPYGGCYPPSGTPFNPQQYPYQNQPRMNPQIPSYPNGFFQAQINGRPPVHPNIPNALRQHGGPVQYQHPQPREVQKPLQQSISQQADSSLQRQPQASFYSQDAELQNISSNYRIRPCDIQEKTSSTDFTRPEELIDFEKLKEDAFVKPKSWQTSEDLPDPGLKEMVYKAELQQQINQNRRARELKLAQEAELEARLERQIEEHNRKHNNTNAEEKQAQARRLIEAQSEAYCQRQSNGLENSEVVLARKLKSREHLGDGDLRQRQQFNHDNTYQKTMNKDLSRGWSPPVPTVRRQLEYGSEIGLPKIRSKHAKGSKKLGLDLELMGALQSTITLERERVEKSLKEKLDGSNGYDGYY